MDRLDTAAGHPVSPASSVSAPPSPSAAGLLLPPTYIHTHHPRRASLTPINLNAVPPMSQMPVSRDREDESSLAGRPRSERERKSLSPSTRPALATTSSSPVHAVGSSSDALRMHSWSGELHHDRHDAQAAAATASASSARCEPKWPAMERARRGSSRPLPNDPLGRVCRPPPSGLFLRRASQPVTVYTSVSDSLQEPIRRSSIAVTVPDYSAASLGSGYDCPPSYSTGQAILTDPFRASVQQDFKFGGSHACLMGPLGDDLILQGPGPYRSDSPYRPSGSNSPRRRPATTMTVNDSQHPLSLNTPPSPLPPGFNAEERRPSLPIDIPLKRSSLHREWDDEGTRWDASSCASSSSSKNAMMVSLFDRNHFIVGV